MDPSQRQRADTGLLWPITPWSERSATAYDGFRRFSYDRAMARPLCDLVAGTLSMTCASQHEEAP